jgi:hypothetical protein
LLFRWQNAVQAVISTKEMTRVAVIPVITTPLGPIFPATAGQFLQPAAITQAIYIPLGQQPPFLPNTYKLVMKNVLWLLTS